MMETQVKISSERIDDIPLILEWLKQIEIAKYIDQKLKKPHGNYQGMSYGQLSVIDIFKNQKNGQDELPNP
jgi:hypothetical protein